MFYLRKMSSMGFHQRTIDERWYYQFHFGSKSYYVLRWTCTLSDIQMICLGHRHFFFHKTCIYICDNFRVTILNILCIKVTNRTRSLQQRCSPRCEWGFLLHYEMRFNPKTSLKPPFFLPTISKEDERSCRCVLGYKC